MGLPRAQPRPKGLRRALVCGGFRPRLEGAGRRASPSWGRPWGHRCGRSLLGMWGLPRTPGSGPTQAGAVGAPQRAGRGGAARPRGRRCAGHWLGFQVRQMGADHLAGFREQPGHSEAVRCPPMSVHPSHRPAGRSHATFTWPHIVASEALSQT